MAHQRIRKFNSKDTYPEQKLDNDFCQAVVTRGGRTVWLRGQCPQNLDDAVNLASHDPAEQTHKKTHDTVEAVEKWVTDLEHASLKHAQPPPRHAPGATLHQRRSSTRRLAKGTRGTCECDRAGG